MKVCSMFSQILPLIPRAEFDRLIRKHEASKGLKGFSNWDQLVSLLFCQLGRAHSLREVHGGMASCAGKLLHLGVKKAPKVSTLSYANRHRDPELYEELFHHMCGCYAGELAARGERRRKFRFKNKLISLDATLIELCVSLFDWADYRRTKGAVKLHMQLEHDGYLPCFAVVSSGKEHEIKVARRMSFERGTILVFDRGYTDYQWFEQLSDEGVFFVTRLKSNAAYKTQEEYGLGGGKNILSDEDITLPGCRHSYRRILVSVPDPSGSGMKYLEFLSNNTKLSAATIAAIYRERWQIELFFKALKQNLKIKTFLGTNENAVRSQIWTALIAMLLVKYLQFKSRYPWSLSNLIALLRMHLFTHRNLWEWLDNHLSPPPEAEIDKQMCLVLT